MYPVFKNLEAWHDLIEELDDNVRYNILYLYQYLFFNFSKFALSPMI